MATAAPLPGRAIQLIVAGQAGLKAGPAFLEALQQSELYLLRPLAVNHDPTQLRLLDRDRGQAHTEPGKRLEWRTWLLQEIVNKEAVGEAAEKLGLGEIDPSDHYYFRFRPRNIRCATNMNADRWIDDFISDVQHVPPDITTLMILFVYDPDDQISGTVTLELARLLRHQINESLHQALLSPLPSISFIGVEIVTADPRERGVLQNLAGYIRRKEVIELTKPKIDPLFDLNMVVNGSLANVYGDVSSEDLNSLSAHLVTSILRRDLTGIDLWGLIDAMIVLKRCHLAFLQVGYYPEEINELRRITHGVKNLNPLTRRRARREYAEFLNRFSHGVVEPFRIVPELTGDSVHALLEGRPLAETLDELTLDGLKRDIHRHLVALLTDRLHSAGQRFDRLLVFQHSHPANNSLLTFQFSEVRVLAHGPDSTSMPERAQDLLKVDDFWVRITDDKDYPSLLTFFAVGGPVVMEHMGYYPVYEHIFEAFSNGDSGQRQEVKRQIAFPECWTSLLPNL